MMDSSSSSYWINIFFGILITINISICKSDQLGRSIDFSTSQWRPVAVAVHQPPSSGSSGSSPSNLPLSSPAHLISIANFDNTDNAHLAQIAQHNAQVLRHIKGINPPITQFHNQYQTYPSGIGNGKQHLIVQTNYNNQNNNNQNFNVHQQLNKNLPRFHYEQQQQHPQQQLHRTTPNILSSSSNVAQTVLPSQHYGDFKQSFISGKPAFIGKPELNPLQFLNGVHQHSSTPKIPTLFASTVNLQPNYAGGIYSSTTSRAPAIRDISYTPALFKATSKPSQHPVVNKLQAHLALAAAAGHPGQNSIDNISPISIDGSASSSSSSLPNSFAQFESSLPPPPPSSNNFHSTHHQQKSVHGHEQNIVQFQNSNLLSYPIDQHSFNGNGNIGVNNNNNGNLGSAFTSYQGQLTPSGHFVSKNNFYNSAKFLPPAINSGYPQQFRTGDFSSGSGAGGVGPLSFALQHESSFGNSQLPQQQFHQLLTSGKLSQKGATIYGPPQSISSLSAAALPTVPPSVLSPFFQQVQLQEQNVLYKQQFKEQQQQLLNNQQQEQQQHQQNQQLSHQHQHQHQQQQQQPQQQQHQQHQQKPKKHHKQQSKVNVQILNDEFTQNLVPPPQSKHKDSTVFRDGFSPMTSTALPVVTSSTATTTTTAASPSPFSSSTILPPPPSSILSHFDADYHRAVEILNKYNIPAISPLQDVNRFVYNSGPNAYQTTASSSSTTTAENYDNSPNAPSFTTEKPNIFQNLNRPTGSSEYKQHKIMHPGYTGIKRPAHIEVSSTKQPALLPTPNTYESGGITHSFFTIEDAITLSPPPPPPVKPTQYQANDGDIQRRPHTKPKKQNQHKIKFIEKPIEQETEIELHKQEQEEEEPIEEEFTTKAIETLKIVSPPPSIPATVPPSLSPITPSTLLVRERQKIRRRRPRPTIQSAVAPTIPTNNDIDEQEQPTESYNVQGQWETSPQTILHQENNRHNQNNQRQRNRYRFRPAAVPPPPSPSNEAEIIIDHKQNIEKYEDQEEQIQEQQYHRHRQEQEQQQPPHRNHRPNTRQRYRNQQRRPVIRPTISYNNEEPVEEVENVDENKEQYPFTVKFQPAVTDIIPPETEIPTSSPLPLTTVSQSLNTIRYDVFDQTQGLPEENDVIIATKNSHFYTTTKLPPPTTLSAKDSEIYTIQSSPTTNVVFPVDVVPPSSPEDDEHQLDNNVSPIIDIEKVVKNTTPQVVDDDEVSHANEHINHRHRLRYREKIKESNNEETIVSTPSPSPPPQLPIISDSEINDEINDENEVTENVQISEDSTSEKSIPKLNKFGGKTRPRFSIKDYRQRNPAAGSSSTSTSSSTTTTTTESSVIPTKQSKLRFPTRTRLLPGLHKKPTIAVDKYNDDNNNNNDSSRDEKENDAPEEKRNNNEQNVLSTNSRRRRPYSKDGNNNNNRYNNRGRSTTTSTEIPSILTTSSSSSQTTFARRFNGTRRDYRNRYSTTSTTTPSTSIDHHEIHRLPSIRNISAIISRRPPNLTLRQRIQQQNQLKLKLENAATDNNNNNNNANDLQKINDRMETDLPNTAAADTDLMEMNSMNDKIIINDQMTASSALEVLDTNDENNNADDIEEKIPSAAQDTQEQKQETSIMKIAKDDHSYRPYMHTAETAYTINSDTLINNTPTKSPDDDINLEYGNDLNSSPSEYSERVAQLTISAANNFNTVNVGGGPSRRIPGYFTLATDDPILPIEAFFPQFKRSAD